MKKTVQQATVTINPLLKRTVKRGLPNNTAPNWRIDRKNFIKTSRRYTCEPGATNLSAGWLGQGHMVGDVKFSFLMYDTY